MRISRPILAFVVSTAATLLLSPSLVEAQRPSNLDDGGWTPVMRNGQRHWTAPMTPVRVGVRADRPADRPAADRVADNAPVQVTVGGDTGNAIEASAFVRPIRASEPANQPATSARPQAEAPYVPDPVAPANLAQSNEPTPARATPAYHYSRSPAPATPTPAAPKAASEPTSPSPADTRPRLPSESSGSASSSPRDMASDAPTLPPVPPLLNDPALDVARQSLSPSSYPSSYPTDYPSSYPTDYPPSYSGGSQSVLWQGPNPADTRPRLPGNTPLPPAVRTEPAPFNPAITNSIPPGTMAAPDCQSLAGTTALAPYTSAPSYAGAPSVYAPAGYGGHSVTAASPVVPALAPGMRPDMAVRRGVLGQPIIHVPGQPLRNFLRWVTP